MPIISLERFLYNNIFIYFTYGLDLRESRQHKIPIRIKFDTILKSFQKYFFFIYLFNPSCKVPIGIVVKSTVNKMWTIYDCFFCFF